MNLYSVLVVSGEVTVTEAGAMLAAGVPKYPWYFDPPNQVIVLRLGSNICPFQARTENLATVPIGKRLWANPWPSGKSMPALYSWTPSWIPSSFRGRFEFEMMGPVPEPELNVR